MNIKGDVCIWAHIIYYKYLCLGCARADVSVSEWMTDSLPFQIYEKELRGVENVCILPAITWKVLDFILMTSLTHGKLATIELHWWRERPNWNLMNSHAIIFLYLLLFFTSGHLIRLMDCLIIFVILTLPHFRHTYDCLCAWTCGFPTFAIEILLLRL